MIWYVRTACAFKPDINKGVWMFRKITIAWVVIVCLSLALLPACGTNSTGGRVRTPTPVPTLVNYEKTIYLVERGSIVAQKEVNGEVVPSKQDDLFFRSSGFVSRITVKLGDKVKKGDLIAEMQVDDLLNQLQTANIDLELAGSNLAKQQVQQVVDKQKAQIEVRQWQDRVALARLDLKNSLADDNTRAMLNLDITLQNLALAELSLKQIEAADDPSAAQAVQRNKLSVGRLEGLLAERRIVAPYDGTIIKNLCTLGKQADAFVVQFIIGDPSQLVIRSPLDTSLQQKMFKDTEIQVAPSQDAADYYISQYLPSFLPYVPQEGEQKNSIGPQFFYFALPPDMPADLAQAGQVVSITVILGRKSDVLLLPPSTIRTYRGLNFVLVQDGDKRRRVEINRLGLQSSERVEIEGDLKVGDRVIGQ
jgi:multidrug efflux pump subunit AcrA (membrane-fusion protein)